jgi:hypothetical protein
MFILFWGSLASVVVITAAFGGIEGLVRDLGDVKWQRRSVRDHLKEQGGQIPVSQEEEFLLPSKTFSDG